MTATVVAVSASPSHTMSKSNALFILLDVGMGVVGDAHRGATVKHRSRVRKDPTQPNLRQVHLIHAELHDDLKAQGFELQPGEMGENITTRGIDLLGLPTGTLLLLGGRATVEITGLRNPCFQLDGPDKGLMEATLERTSGGELVRKAGVMAVVVEGGEVRPGDEISVQLPSPPYRPLQPV